VAARAKENISRARPSAVVVAFTAAAAALLGAAVSWFAAYPTRPVRTIIGFAPGGSARQMSASVFHPSSERPDCVADEAVGFEPVSKLQNFGITGKNTGKTGNSASNSRRHHPQTQSPCGVLSEIRYRN
jgi:hypothetical protein